MDNDWIRPELEAKILHIEDRDEKPNAKIRRIEENATAAYMSMSTEKFPISHDLNTTKVVL